ncbi:hypothetical protein OE88DRAFT_266672 [Heliocybe sulcata]|uniref:Uncharacterized protein n=1 Tax=Heliocybe sulcata TaxID=5364 RepID=A0A5C3N355_9AGAM|nr:hypothetical protein OE88DRAFT_266672 [Heliocybe sulcata]
MSAAARIGAASNELPRPLHAHSSGLAVEDGSIEDHPTEDDPIEDAAVNWRNERYRVNLERSGTGLPRIAPSHSRSWEIVSDDDGIQSGGTGLPRVEPSYSGSFEIVSDDDGIQSSMNRVFEDLRSFNETLEATRESISLFLNDRPSPVHGSGDDHSSTRAAVESRRESYASRQPLRTPFRGRLDQEEDTGSSLSNRSVPNGTRNTYNPFPTTRAAADIRSSPDPLDLINSGDRDDLASRFRLRAVSSRSFMARRTNESSNASRLPPPSLAPRTESHLHRALQLEGWEADDILTSLDERANDWFPPLASPRADADHERRPSDNSLSELGDSRTRWTGIIRPDPPVGLRSRGDGISSASDYRRRTSWASSAATSRQSVESRLEEDPRRLLAEEHRTPFSVPRPPWREGQWTESAGTATQSNPSFNPPALIPLLGSGASRTSLSRAPSASSYRSTAVAYIPDWRRLGERNIPPAYRRSGQTRLPVILPPLTRAASARRLPSIATLPENDDSSRDEVPGVRPPTSSAGSAPTALPLPSCPHLPPLGQWDDADESELATASTDGSVPLGPFGRWGEPDQMQSAATTAASSQSSLFGQWDGPDHLEPVATGGSGSQYRGIDLNAYHDGPFRASLRRSIELSRSRTSSQPTTRLSDSSSRPSLSALHRQRNSSEVSSRSQREALAHRLGRLHPLHTATDEHERSISRETRHPSPRRLAQRPPATNARPSRAGSDRPLPDPRRVDSALVSAVRGRFSRPREADISSPDWWDQSPAELPDDIFSELNDLPGALDVDIRPPTRSHNEFQQAIQVLRNEGRRDSVYGRRLRRRPWDDMDATDASNETQASRELEEWASRRTSARPRSTTARPTDLIREPSRRATSQRSQSRSPSRVPDPPAATGSR